MNSIHRAADSTTSPFYLHLLAHSNKVLLLGLALTLALAAGLSQLVKDTSVDAFVPADHPSVLSRDAIRATFGLQDPIVISIQATSGDAFEPVVLNRLLALHQQIEAMPQIRQNGVKSLVSQPHISSQQQTLLVEPLLQQPVNATQAKQIKKLAAQMPPFNGTLVSYDQSALTIVAELLNQGDAEQVYRQLATLIAEPHPEYQIYLAGQGAVSGYLSSYIDADSRKLQPVVFVVVLLMLWLAFRQTRSLIAPLAVIIPSALGTIGLMGWLQVPYYAITSALPVIITAIAVADSIHILTAYFGLKATYPERSQAEHISLAVSDMLKPISYTTITTMAGFIGLSVASIMPPVSAFGAFAALGVLLAWVYSVLLLPCLLLKLNLPVSPVFVAKVQHPSNQIGRALGKLAFASANRPLLTASLLVLVLVLGATAANWVKVDRAQIANFTPKEPIRIAHHHINQHYAGTAYLDIVLRTPQTDGLLDNGVIAKVPELQAWLGELPFVNKVVAVTDQLQQLHWALIEEGESPQLPSDPDILAQYLLLYASSSASNDVSDQIDNQYQELLLRAYMNTNYFSQEKPVVEQVQHYLNQQFGSASSHSEMGKVRAELGGRVNVDYHWMTRLQDSHLNSIAVSLSLVWLFACLLFRSLVLGTVALTPVLFAVVSVYGVMGWLGIHLEPATSMFAAIAIGVGIDFAIHFIERLQQASKAGSPFNDELLAHFNPAARACFFNAAALACGFATLMVSELPTLQRFGLMITLACVISFTAALFIVPLAFRLLANKQRALRKTHSVLTLVAVTLLLPTTIDTAHAEQVDGNWVAQQVWQRQDGEQVKRQLIMQLTDHNGNSRERRAQVLRLTENGIKKTRIHFEAPRRVKHTGFLTFDYLNAEQQDEQWMYLPAIKKTRRIPVSGRGESFMGSDFSYEEIKSDFKFALHDYHFTLLDDQPNYYVLQAEPQTPQIAKDLGIGKLVAQVSKQHWLPMQVNFWDTRLQPLKHMQIDQVQIIEGYPVVMQVTMQHQQQSHRSVFRYTDVQFLTQLSSNEFSVNQLAKRP